MTRTTGRRFTAILASAGTIILLATARRASAQVPFGGGTLSGTVDVGGRAFTNKPSEREWARFGEYRNMGDGAYLPNAHLHFASADQFFADLRLFDVGRDDQQFSLAAYRPGKFTFEASWNQIPHSYSSTSQIYSGSADVLTLPTPRPVATALNASPYLTLVSSRWDAARVALKTTVKPGWDVAAEYNHTKRQGERPMGMSFGSPGNNYREIPEPINSTAQNIKVSQGIGGRSRYQLQMGYDLSIFSNSSDQVQADNPMTAVDAVGTASAGRMALAPSNLAHTVSIGGTATRLPLKTTVTGVVAYSLWKQDHAFLPYTRNPAIVTPALPASSLNGDQRTINFQLAANSRPLRSLTLTARYRRYEMQDKTPDIIFPLEVVSDRSLTNGTFERERSPFGRQLGRFEVGWKPVGPVYFKAGWNWERWNRSDTREVPITNEHQPRAALDVELSQFLVVRTAYSHSWRRFSSYVPATGNFAPFRRYDLSDRDQDRVDVITEITPPGPFGFTVTYNLADNNYLVGNNTGYGVRTDRNWALGGEVSWTSSDRATVYAGYQYESAKLNMLNRTIAATTDSASYDFVTDNNDRFHTVTAGLQVTLVPDRLDIGGMWNFYDGKTEVLSSNPRTPVGGTAANNLNATAANWDPLTHKGHRIDATVRYRVAHNWSAMVTYGFQKFKESDFRTNGLVPAFIAPGATWNGDLSLGNDVLPFQANYLIVTLGYNIGMTPHALRYR